MPINQYVNQSTNKFANQTTKAKTQKIKKSTDFDATIQNNAKVQCKYPFQATNTDNTLTNTDNTLTNRDNTLTNRDNTLTNSERKEIRQVCLQLLEQLVVGCKLYIIGLLINIQEFLNEVNNKAIK